MSIPYVLIPTPVLDADVTAFSPGAEDPTTVWAAGTYAIGDLRHRVGTHRVYRRVTAGTDAVGEFPELFPDRWQNLRPTNKWAPFDTYVSTQATAATTLSYTINIGFSNAVAFYGLAGNSISVVVKDEPGGSVIKTMTSSLVEGSSGWYSYYFGRRRKRALTRLLVRDIPLSATAEMTVTVTGAACAIGVVAYGDLKPLVRAQGFGVQVGARVKLVDYSYIKRNEDGSVEIKRRRSARDMSIELVVPASDFNYAIDSLEAVLAVPAAWIGSDLNDFDALNVFGIANSELSYESNAHGIIPINVQGLI